MPTTVADFQRLAQTASYANRSIVVDDAQQPTDIKFRGSVFSHSNKVNDATMKAFRDALGNDPNYGAFGLHAFDTILGSRAQLKKSLRACDIKAVFSHIEELKEKRFANELERQMTTNPAFMELGDSVRRAVKDIVRNEASQHGHALRQCKTPEDVSKLANNTIMVAIQRAKQDPTIVDKADKGIRRLHHGEEQIQSETPMGLSKLHGTGATYGKKATSVEDQVRKGTLGSGMRVNFTSTTRPAIFEKLKTNGVEPGFIYHNDWSPNDTRGLMNDIHSRKMMDSINDFIQNGSQALQDKTNGKSYLEKGLIIGRAHPAGIVFAAEYVLSKELDKLGQNPQPDTPLLKAIKLHFGPNVQKTDFFPADGSQPQGAQLTNLAKLKKDCFVPLRDAVMTYSTTAKNIDPNSQLPVFKHFTERHILKLDYNEGDRTSFDFAPKDSQFMLPERVIVKNWYGAGYRAFRLTTPDKASIGAASEALANDITRLLKVPAQDLTLVRGKYSDGHPKIMLEAKFAEGYKDLDTIYIEDGHIKADVNAAPLGQFKAIFLALADRDAIGSHGQNKGLIGDPNDKTQQKTFFAIDPGHSLEGNGKNLEIRDDLSFRETTFRKHFHNFSVFDDDTRFNKLQGVIRLRDLRASGAIRNLFDDYRKAFNPNEPGISDAEKNIRRQMQANFDKMQNELTIQIGKITGACYKQLQLYDALNGNATMQEGAINAIENLEKLTSPTTWMSKEGKVELKHLSIPQETRIPWTAEKNGDTLVYTSQKPLSQEMQQRLQAQAQKAPQGTMTVTINAQGMATINVPMGNAQAFFDTFSEGNIAQLTHPTEYQQRLAAHPQPPAQAAGPLPLPPPVAAPQQQPPAPQQPPVAQQPQAPFIDNPPPPTVQQE